MTIQVFDPAMCCSTGVCGPSVDPALAAFAGDLDWLTEQGVEVSRINLGQEPGRFVENEQVKALLDTDGEAALPAVFVDGELRSSGRFPSRDELVAWAALELAADSPVLSDVVIVELAAIGAAIGSNCEPCFKYHYAEARKLGLTNDDLALAVRTAQTVKDVPAAKVLDTAARLLGVDTVALGGAATTAETGSTDAGGCCGGASADEAVAAAPETATSSGCC